MLAAMGCAVLVTAETSGGIADDQTRPLSRGISALSRRLAGATALGQEEPFPRPRLSARCRFSQGTFAGTWGNVRDAPLAAIP
jgi:hypothetical protein